MTMFFSGSLMAQTEQPEFKPSGKVWGYAFGDFAYKAGSDTTITFGATEYAKMKKEESKFAFRRIYLGYDYKFAPKLTGKILLEGGDNVLTSDGKRTVFIKGAELEWKDLVPNSALYIGQSSTPTWSLIPEKIWAYRSAEKTITDARKLGKSNDFGVRLTGSFDKEGVLGYTIMFGNGTAEKVEFDKFKKVYGSLNASLLDKKLIIELYGDYEKSIRFDEEQPTTTFKAFLAYQTEKFTIGFEPVLQVQKKAKQHVEPDATHVLDAKPFGYTIFARGTLKKDKLSAFARFDAFSFDMDYEEGDDVDNPYDENFFLLGFDFTPHPNWHIMPNIWVNTYEDKRSDKTDRDPDVVPRLTFFFNLK